MNDDFTTTPNYSLYKPVPNADYDLWGDHLNANADTLDALIRKLDARGSSGNLLLVTSFLPAGQPDGITDNAAGIQAAIDAAAGMTPDIDRAAAPGFARLLIQAASAPYIIGTGLLIPSNSHLVVEQGATLKIADAANCSMLLIVPGASNIAIDLYGALDGNASQQTFGSATVDLFDFERDGGGSASGGVCSLGRCSDIQVDGFRQGTITNFYHWGVNIVCATNAEVRDVSVSKCGASTEFAGLSTRVNITGGSYTTATGAMTITTGTPHGINVGDTFTYVAASGPAAQVQGEYVALTVADALTVTCQAAANLVGGNPALTDGRVGTCTKCYNAGFVGSSSIMSTTSACASTAVLLAATSEAARCATAFPQAHRSCLTRRSRVHAVTARYLAATATTTLAAALPLRPISSGSYRRTPRFSATPQAAICAAGSPLAHATASRFRITSFTTIGPSLRARRCSRAR